MAAFAAKGLRWGTLKPTVANRRSDWFPLLGERQKDILTFTDHMDDGYLMVDLQPQISSRRLAVKEQRSGKFVQFAPTMLPDQEIWISSFGNERLLVGREALLLQGLPVCKCEGAVEQASEKELTQMAGSMCALPVLLALLDACVNAF